MIQAHVFQNLINLKRKKRGSSFKQLFFIFAVTSSILLIISIIFIYRSTRQSVLTNIQDSKIMTTNQIKNTFEREIQTIEKSFNAYSTTNEFYNIVQQPFSIHDFKTYREINSQLNYFSTFSLPGTIYSLLSLDQNWHISNGTLSHFTAEEKQEIEQHLIEDQDANLFWLKSEDGITSVSLLPVFENKKLAIGLAEIPNSSIEKLLDVSSSTTPFFIVNRDNEMIFSSNENEMDIASLTKTIEFVRQQTVENDSGVLEPFAEQTDDSSIIYSKSDYNNWLYITYLPSTEVSKALVVTQVGLFLMTVILIVLAIIVSHLFASRFTKPIELLKNHYGHIPVEGDHVNDWDIITRGINKIVTERDTLEHIYDRERPELKKQFMLNLYRNRISTRELEERVTLLDYPISQNSQFMLMLIQIDDYGERVVDNQDVYLLGINQIISELIPRSMRLTPTVLNNSQQATLLVFPSQNQVNNQRYATEWANQVMEYLREYMRLSVSIAFSPLYDDLLSTKTNLDKGKEVLSYRLLLGEQSIIFHRDIEQLISLPKATSYPEKIEKELFQQIRLGEVEKVKEYGPKTLEAIITSSHNPTQVKVSLNRFSFNIIELAESMNIESLSHERVVEIYEAILHPRHPAEVENLLVDKIIIPLTEMMYEKTSQQFQGLSDQIKEIIQNEYTEDISLETIGDRLHYNPNYLSNIFKKETGITFSEYLTTVRFDIAKEWLCETDITIKEISERLQYRNPQNFIRSFKKKEHMTPGEYRKSNQPV